MPAFQAACLSVAWSTVRARGRAAPVSKGAEGALRNHWCCAVILLWSKAVELSLWWRSQLVGCFRSLPMGVFWRSLKAVRKFRRFVLYPSLLILSDGLPVW